MVVLNYQHSAVWRGREQLMYETTIPRSSDCPDVKGAFTDSLQEDNWILTIDGSGQFWVQWLCGKHYFAGKRKVYVRKNRFGGEYYQFCRPRLYGEERARKFCVPAAVVREVMA